MKESNIDSAGKPDVARRLVDAVVTRAQAEQESWVARHEALRGCGSMESIFANITRLGVDGLPRLLSQLSYPSTWTMRQKIARDGDNWSSSQVELAVKKLPNQDIAAQIYFASETIEQRDRLKAWTQFWEVWGIHPDDLPIPSILGLLMHLIWHTIQISSAARELERRAGERRDDTARSHYAGIVRSQPEFVDFLIGLLCELATAEAPATGAPQGLSGDGEDLRQWLLQLLSIEVTAWEVARA